MTTVQIGDILFQPRGPLGFTFAKLTDWDSLPDSKSDAESRPQAPGDFDFEDVSAAAVPSLEGTLIAASRVELLSMKDTLKGLRRTGAQVPFTVTDEAGSRTRLVSIRNVKIGQDRQLLNCSYAIDTLATDPLMYGPTMPATTGLAKPGVGLTFPVTFPINFGPPGDSGRAVATNVGTADTLSRFRVGGGAMVGGFTLVHVESGRRIQVVRDLPAGSVIFVDSRDGTVTIDGSPIPGYITRSEWWPVPAGGSATVQFIANGPTSGTPTLTVLTDPAYL